MNRFTYSSAPLIAAAALTLILAPTAAEAHEKPSNVTAVWWAQGTNQWPVEGQTLAAFTPSDTLAVDFIKAEAAKLGCGFTIQGDLYADDKITKSLLAGGKLFGPSNPTESWPGGKYKAEFSTVFYTGDCPVVPEYPGDKITSEDTAGVQDCELGSVSWFHVTLTATGTLVDNVWVYGEPVETGREEATRPMTEDELAACPPVVVPPVDPPTTAPPTTDECDPNTGDCLVTTGVETDAAILAGLLAILGAGLVVWARINRRKNLA